MPDALSIIFGGSQQAPQLSKNMKLALFLRMLAEMLDEDQPPQQPQNPFEEPEMRVRPHFMPVPSGG